MKKNYTRISLIFYGAMLSPPLLILIFGWLFPKALYFIMAFAFAVFIAGIVFYGKNLTCPNCGSFLGQRGMGLPNHCPGCGEKVINDPSAKWR